MRIAPDVSMGVEDLGLGETGSRSLHNNGVFQGSGISTLPDVGASSQSLDQPQQCRQKIWPSFLYEPVHNSLPQT